jgi:hypothetical protein
VLGIKDAVLDLVLALIVKFDFPVGRKDASALGQQPLWCALGEEIVLLLLCVRFRS